jgi:hypothetical protein
VQGLGALGEPQVEQKDRETVDVVGMVMGENDVINLIERNAGVEQALSRTPGAVNQNGLAFALYYHVGMLARSVAERGTGAEQNKLSHLISHTAKTGCAA